MVHLADDRRKVELMFVSCGECQLQHFCCLFTVVNADCSVFAVDSEYRRECT